MDEKEEYLNPDITRRFLPKRTTTSGAAMRAAPPEGDKIPVKHLTDGFAKLPTKDKIIAIRDVYGEEEAERFLYKSVNTMLNNGYSSVEIAHLLDSTPDDIRKIKAKLKVKMSTDLQAAEPNEFIGERIAFYNNIKENAQRSISKYASNPHVQKHFIDLALRAEADMHRLLQIVGFYEYKKFDPGVSGYSAASDASEIKSVIGLIASGGDFESIIEDNINEEGIDIS